MIVNEIIESSLLTDKSSFYELSILIGMDSFVFAVVDERNRLLALKHWEFTPVSGPQIAQYEIAFKNEPFLGLTFKKVAVGVINNQFTLIPKKLYDHNQRQVYLQNITKVDTNKSLILVDNISLDNACTVFAINELEHSFFKTKFPNVSFYHSTSPLAHGLLQFSNSDSKTLLVDIKRKSMDIVFADNGKIKLINTYPLKNEEDCLYFTLLIFDQFGIDPAKQKVYLSGDIAPNSLKTTLLSKYIQHLEFVSSSHLTYGKNFEAYDAKHKYFNLLNIHAYTHDSAI